MEPLKDPRNDRVVKTLKLPPSAPLTSALIWDKSNNLSKVKRHSELESYKGSLEKGRFA